MICRINFVGLRAQTIPYMEYIADTIGLDPYLGLGCCKDSTKPCILASSQQMLFILVSYANRLLVYSLLIWSTMKSTRLSLVQRFYKRDAQLVIGWSQSAHNIEVSLWSGKSNALKGGKEI